MKVASIVLFLCLATFGATAQKNKEIDSLNTAILKNKYDSSFYRIANKYSRYYLGKKNDSTLYFTNLILQQPLSKINKQYILNAYNQKAYAYYLKSDYENAIKVYSSALKFATVTNDTLDILDFIINSGNIYIEKGDNKTALEQYLKAKQIAEKSKKYLKKEMLALTNIAYVYKQIGDYENAENFYYQSIKIFENSNDFINTANSYNNLASLMISKKDYIKAKFYNSKALQIQEERKLDAGLAISYQLNSQIYIEEKKNKDALFFLMKSKKIYESQNDIRQLVNLYNALGSIFYETNEIDSAIFYINKSVILGKKTQNFRLFSTSYNALAKSYLKINNLKEVENYLDSAFLFLSKNENKNQLKSYYSIQLELNQKKGKIDLAFAYFKKYDDLKDSLLNEENISTMNKLNIEYETEKKNIKLQLLSKADSIKALEINNQQLAINKNLFALSQQQLALAEDSILLFTQNETLLQNKLDASLKEEKINTLTKEGLQKQLALQQQQAAIKQKNNTIIIIVIGAILLLVIAYAFYRKKQLQQQAFMAQEQAKQREQITKAVIDAEEAERKRIASDLHDGVGQLFSAVKMNLAGLIDRIDLPKHEDKFLAEKTLALVDESCKEVRVISHKMMPNFLLKSGIASDIRSFIEKIDEQRLKITFETNGFSDQLEYNEEVILYRVIQELINNVIKHAQANELYLLLEKTKHKVAVEVTDNGKGFNYDNAIAKGGLGLKNILVRIEYLKGTINFTPNKVSGTTVKINIPIA